MTRSLAIHAFWCIVAVAYILACLAVVLPLILLPMVILVEIGRFIRWIANHYVKIMESLGIKFTMFTHNLGEFIIGKTEEEDG